MNDEPTYRCGWRTQHSEGDGALVLVSDGEIRFYLPSDLYEVLDDEAFLELCEAKRRRYASSLEA